MYHVTNRDSLGGNSINHRSLEPVPRSVGKIDGSRRETAHKVDLIENICRFIES